MSDVIPTALRCSFSDSETIICSTLFVTCIVLSHHNSRSPVFITSFGFHAGAWFLTPFFSRNSWYTFFPTWLCLYFKYRLSEILSHDPRIWVNVSSCFSAHSAFAVHCPSFCYIRLSSFLCCLGYNFLFFNR